MRKPLHEVFVKDAYIIKVNFIMLFLLITIIAIPAMLEASDRTERQKSIIETLTAPELEGREAVTKSSQLTAIYLSDAMRSAGLQCIKEQKGDESLEFYLHEVPVSSGMLAKERCSVNLRTADVEVELLWGEGFYIFPKSPIPLFETYSVVDCGYGLTKEDFEHVIAGSFAVVAAGNSENQNDRRSASAFKVTNARNAGAAGLLVVYNYIEGSEELTEVKDKAGVPQRRLISLVDDSAEFPIVFLDASDSQVAYWYKSIVNGEEGEVSLSVNYDDMKSSTEHNVIGVLKGISDEWVVLGAHYDHEGLVDPEQGNDGGYYPGADDNASGVAVLLEVARHFALIDKPLQLNLCFVLFAAEEKGMLGSRYFADNLPFDKSKLKTMFNLDMVGRDGYRTMQDAIQGKAEPEAKLAIAYYSANSPRLKQIIEMSAMNVDLDVMINPINSFRFSDAGSFHTASIPTVHLFGGFHSDYSSVNDTPDKINYDKLQRMTILTEFILKSLMEDVEPITFDKSIVAPRSGMGY